MTLLAGALAPLADCWHHGGGGWFLFPLFWIVLIVLLVWGFRRGRWGGSRYWHHQRRETAAEVLEHRFARGEIDDDEYRRRRSVLGPEEKQ